MTILESTLNSGDSEMKLQVNKMYNTIILLIEVNFNVYEHLNFAYKNILSLGGIRTLTGVQANGRNKGQYSFLLKNDVNVDLLKTNIQEQFENYFIQF